MATKSASSVLFLLSLCLGFAFFILFINQAHELARKHRRLEAQTAVATWPPNKMTFLSVLGLDGAGVSAIIPIVATIGKTCESHVTYRNTYIKSSRMKGRSSLFVSHLKSMQSSNYGPVKQVMIVEDAIFPFENELINSTAAEKKEKPAYNVEWIYRHLKDVDGVTQRYLYVQRDLHHTTASSLRANENFESRMYSLIDFNRHIELEHLRISAQQPGLWGLVQYEWFTEMRNCTALVSAIIDFVGWEQCDVVHACNMITTKLIPTKEKIIRNQDQHDLATLHAESTTIPSLVVNESAQQYHYQPFVSDRKPFTFVTAQTPRTPQSPRLRESFNSSAKLVTPNWVRGAGDNSKAPWVRGYDMNSKAQPPEWMRGGGNSSRWRPQEGVRGPYHRSNVFLPDVRQDRWGDLSGPTRNNLSFMYLVGVEGTGHHGVTPAVASIAKTCGYHVIYENSGLRKFQAKHHADNYQISLHAYRKLFYPNTNKVLIIEDQSFPTGQEQRVSTMEQKKASGFYDLEWVLNQTSALGVKTRFLHLTRDFYKTVASHPEFDNGFEAHAQVLHDFIWYIDAEYKRINARQPGLWATVHYEWFRDMKNCSALVSGIIDFAGWDNCDVDFACQVLQQTIRNSTKRSVNETEYAYAQSLNVDISVPELDISPDRNISFSQAIADRSMTFSFSFTPDKKMKGTTVWDNLREWLGRKEGMDDFRGRHQQYPVMQQRLAHTKNNVSVLYLTGVQGAGHARAAAAVVAIAHSCSYHVVRGNKALRRAQTKQQVQTFRMVIESVRRSSFPKTNKVLVLEDQVFPSSGAYNRSTSIEQIKASGEYNLEWIYQQSSADRVDLRFLHLTRAFHESVAASQPKLVKSFEAHAQVLHDFIWYIDAEYQRINAREPGLWATVHYEWFRDMKNCLALVSAIIDFAGWDDCDISEACERLQHTQRSSSKKVPLSINATEFAYAQSLNVSISIPELDTSAGRNFSFTRVTPSNKSTRYAPPPPQPTPVKKQNILLAKSREMVPRGHHGGQSKTASSDRNYPTAQGENDVSVLYLTGVQGAGHARAAAAVVAIAHSCNYHVVRGNKALRRAQSKLLSRSYRAVLSSLQHSIFRGTKKVSVLEGTPLYADGELSTETSAEKRDLGKNNLAWVHARAVEAGAKIQFLYLQRPFPEVMASSYNASVPFALQAKSTHDFVWYINEERVSIEAKEAGLWAQLEVAWLVEALDAMVAEADAEGGADVAGMGEGEKRCEALVTALVKFTRWEDCNVEQACSALAAFSAVQPWREALPALTAEEMNLATAYAGKVLLDIPSLRFSSVAAGKQDIL